jgi:microcystin-dependent protein
VSIQNFPTLNTPLVNDSGIITTPWFRLFNSLWTRTGSGTGGGVIPVGTMMAFAGGTIPDGWLACNGQAVARAQFSILFSVIGVTWGPGDGSTSFNVPDSRGRVIIGAGGSFVLAANGGAMERVIGQTNLPNVPFTVNDPGHTHAVTDPGHSHSARNVSSLVTAGAVDAGGTTGNTGSATTGISIVSASTGITVSSGGSDTPLDTTPAYIAAYAIIKV